MNHLNKHFEDVLLELKNSLNELNVEENDLEQLFNSKKYIITLHKKDNRKPVFINNHAKHFFGMEKNWISQENCARLLKNYHYTCYKGISDAFSRLRTSEDKTHRLSFKLLNRQNQWVDFNGCAATLIKDDFGNLQYSVIIGQEFS